MSLQDDERIAKKLLDLGSRSDRVQIRNGITYLDGFALGNGTVELRSQVARDRRRRFIPGSLCDLLRLAFIYKLKDKTDKTQEVWAVNNGQHHLLLSVPSATFVYPDTYTYETVFPGYWYKTYELIQSTRIRISTQEIIAESNSVIDPGDGDGLVGYRPSITTTTTEFYSDGEYVPPAVSMRSASLSLTEAWDEAIYPYWVYTNLPVSDDQPSYTTFQNRSMVESGSPMSTGVYIDVPMGEDSIKSVLAIQPWRGLSTLYISGDGSQNNPEQGFEFVNEDGSPSSTPTDFIRYWIQSAREIVTAWDGTLSVSVPSGQFRRPDEQRFIELDAYLSHEGGRFVALVRTTDRPEGELPPEPEGGWQEDDIYPYFPSRHLYHIGGDGVESFDPERLQSWIKPLYDSPETKSQIADRFSEEWDTPQNQVLKSILSAGVITADYWLAKDTPHVVRSGNTTVWGWEFRFDSPEIIRDKLLNPPEPLHGESPPPVTVSYIVYPIHAVSEPEEGDPYVAYGPPIPLADEVDGDRTLIPLKWDGIGDIDPDDFELLAVSGTWSKNSIQECRNTKDVSTPDAPGGS